MVSMKCKGNLNGFATMASGDRIRWTKSMKSSYKDACWEKNDKPVKKRRLQSALKKEFKLVESMVSNFWGAFLELKCLK